MSYKIVWKVNGKVVPMYYGKKFKSKRAAKNAISKKRNIIGHKMSVRKR